MADSKRLSLGGRVATPRLPTPTHSTTVANTGAATPPSSSLSNEQLLGRALGAHIRIQTTSNRSLTGYIFALSPYSPTLTLTPTPIVLPASPGTFTPTPPPPTTYTLISLSSITSLTLLEPAGTVTAKSTLPPIDQASATQRANRAIANLHAAEARRGKNVPREAQLLFDALHRTLPVSWDGPRIVVLGTVVIGPPWTEKEVKSVKGKAGNERELARVRKVVESERKKIEKANGASSSAGTSARGTPELRKGG